MSSNYTPFFGAPPPRSAPTSPGAPEDRGRTPPTSQAGPRRASRGSSRPKTLFGNGNFFDQLSQNISNSLQDITRNIFNDSFMDMGKILNKTCNSCGVNFSVFLRKKRCNICFMHFCSSCMEYQERQRVYHCKRCLVFRQLPLDKERLNTLRVRDLKWFLSSRNIPVESCNEKRELVDLIIERVNPVSSQARRHSAGNVAADPPPVPPTAPPSAFSTSNLNSETHPSQAPPETPTTTTTTTTVPPPPVSNPSNLQAASSTSQLNVSTFNLSDIKEESEIKDLSVRQLKLLLARNFVDFKGCVEREELIGKATLLWQDKQINAKLKDEIEASTTLGDENTCKICMENVIDCVLLECGHMLTCTDCGKILSECPVCRQFVTRVVHVFKA